MVYLKIIFYGILAFIERHPLFTLFIILISIFAPVVWKAIGWVIVAVLFALLLIVGVAAFRMHKMRKQVEDQFRGTSGGFSSGFSSAQGMSLEELVRRMQAEAEAKRRSQDTYSSTTTQSSTAQQKRVNDKVGDYVDFEEVE
jgi:glucan phosphoethanolaminetransferase (alkaline phosphatase superfamily)